MPAWLWALLFAAFVFYTDDYVVAGVLPEIGADLMVSHAQVGQLVTVFSITVAVTAPVAGVALAGTDRRLVFTVALLVFVLANGAAALSPSFGVLVAVRVLAAVAAAAATPALFAVAASLAPPGMAGRYLAVVSLGVTGAIAAGVPVGTWVGGALGWRATFATMAVLGVAALLALHRALPPVTTSPQSPPPVREQLRVLGSWPVSLGLLANAFLMTGSMMLLTYLAPFLAELADVEIAARGILFGLSGLAGIAGILAGGRASDVWGPDRALLVGIAVFLATMAAFLLLWPLRPVSLLPVAVITTVWAAAAFWNTPAIQARLHTLAGPVGSQALALNTSATYLGVAGGGVVGGAVLTTGGAGVLPLAAAVFGTLALGTLALAARTSTRLRVQT